MPGPLSSLMLSAWSVFLALRLCRNQKISQCTSTDKQARQRRRRNICWCEDDIEMRTAEHTKPNPRLPASQIHRHGCTICSVHRLQKTGRFFVGHEFLRENPCLLCTLWQDIEVWFHGLWTLDQMKMQIFHYWFIEHWNVDCTPLCMNQFRSEFRFCSTPRHDNLDSLIVSKMMMFSSKEALPFISCCLSLFHKFSKRKDSSKRWAWGQTSESGLRSRHAAIFYPAGWDLWRIQDPWQDVLCDSKALGTSTYSLLWFDRMIHDKERLGQLTSQRERRVKLNLSSHKNSSKQGRSETVGKIL